MTYEVRISLKIDEAENEDEAIEKFRQHIQRVKASVFEVKKWSLETEGEF